MQYLWTPLIYAANSRFVRRAYALQNIACPLLWCLFVRMSTPRPARKSNDILTCHIRSVHSYIRSPRRKHWFDVTLTLLSKVRTQNFWKRRPALHFTFTRRRPRRAPLSPRRRRRQKLGLIHPVLLDSFSCISTFRLSIGSPMFLSIFNWNDENPERHTMEILAWITCDVG